MFRHGYHYRHQEVHGRCQCYQQCRLQGNDGTAEAGDAIVVREVKPRKKNTITYAQMLQYISLVENSEKYLATFHVMRAEAGSKNDRYNRVLSWFRKTFPDFYDLPALNEKNEIIVKAAEATTPVEASEEKAILPFAS